MGDSQASLFAQRCFKPGMAKVTFGTGSSILLNIGSGLKHSRDGIVTTIAWVLEGAPTYCYEGLINFSAATIAWLKDQLGLIDSATETEALAFAVEDSGGVYVVPAFGGLSASYWKPMYPCRGFTLMGVQPGIDSLCSLHPMFWVFLSKRRMFPTVRPWER